MILIKPAKFLIYQGIRIYTFYLLCLFVRSPLEEFVGVLGCKICILNEKAINLSITFRTLA